MGKKRSLCRKGLILALLTMLLAGCQWVQDPKSLLSVPKLPKEQANLASIVYSQLPEGASIVQPTHSSDGSKIRIADLNDDGRAEAIVFYETPDREVRLHGMILESDVDSWKVAAEFEGEGVKLDRVDIMDVTGDNTLDIIIGYSSADPTANKSMVIYSFHDKALKKIFEQPYSQYVIDDLDRNMKSEIYVLINRKSKSPVVLNQFGYKDNKITKLSEKQMDPEIAGVSNMISGHLSKDRRGIVIDAIADPNYALTMAYSIDSNGDLYEVFPKDLTIKSWLTLSEDVNSDGIIEVAIPEKPLGWELHEEFKVPFFTNYFQWDSDKGLKLVQRQFRDHYERYHFIIPLSWYGRVSIDTKSRVDEDLRFYDIHSNETLAEVRFFSVEAWDRYKDKWTYLAAYGDQVIGIYSKEPLNLNDGNTKLPDVEEDKETDPLNKDKK